MTHHSIPDPVDDLMPVCDLCGRFVDPDELWMGPVDPAWRLEPLVGHQQCVDPQ